MGNKSRFYKKGDLKLIREFEGGESNEKVIAANPADNAKSATDQLHTAEAQGGTAVRGDLGNFNGTKANSDGINVELASHGNSGEVNQRAKDVANTLMQKGLDGTITVKSESYQRNKPFLGESVNFTKRELTDFLKSL